MTRPRRHLRALRRRRDQGSLTVFMAIIAIGIVIVVGLVVDGGALARAKSQATTGAREAARAAGQSMAGQVQDRGDITLDTARAANTARTYLTAAEVTGTVTVTGTTINVDTTVTKPTIFLGLIGIGSVTGSAHSSATPLDR